MSGAALSAVLRVPPILIQIHPSRRLAALLAGVHGLSLFVITILQIEFSWRLLLAAIVLASAWQRLRIWRSSGVTRLHLGREGQCEIEKVGAGGTATVQDYSVIFGSLIVLTLAGEWGRKSLVLLPDSSDADSLRRLRVWLRASA